MSLLTQCPACQTYYRVVQDQLRISDGWVKCGQCGDIFDASQHLLEIEATPNDASIAWQTDVPATNTSDGSSGFLPLDLEVPPAAAQDIADACPVEVAALTGSDEVMRPSDVKGSLDALTDEFAPSGHLDDSPDSSPQALMPSLDFPEDHPHIEPTIEFVQADQTDRVLRDVEPPAFLLLTPAQEDAEPVGEPTPDEPVTFLRDQATRSVWQTRAARVGLGLVSAVLVLALPAQWVYQQRGMLAASRPELRPSLQTACAWLGCDVSPLRQIESLTIDSVTFNRLEVDAYKLSFVVKNASDLPLAYPAVELVLTDAEDQPAYRRVFSSQELGASAAALSAKSDWSVTTAVQIVTAASTQRVFGYRLLVFYP